MPDVKKTVKDWLDEVKAAIDIVEKDLLGPDGNLVDVKSKLSADLQATLDIETLLKVDNNLAFPAAVENALPALLAYLKFAGK